MRSVMNFTEGECYTRPAITQVLGGSTRDFFPHNAKHVACGCFRRDLNPEAPSEVLVGNTDNRRRWAEVFATQTEAVPIFLKERTNHWKYVGLWRCVSKSEDEALIRARNRLAGRDEISMILRLEKVSLLHAYQDALVLKGLADMRKGRVVSHEEVAKRLKKTRRARL
jgi:hypothetical protein